MDRAGGAITTKPAILEEDLLPTPTPSEPAAEESVTVDTLVTLDSTPGLTGTVDDPGATIAEPIVEYAGDLTPEVITARRCNADTAVEIAPLLPDVQCPVPAHDFEIPGILDVLPVFRQPQNGHQVRQPKRTLVDGTGKVIEKRLIQVEQQDPMIPSPDP